MSEQSNSFLAQLDGESIILDNWADNERQRLDEAEFKVTCPFHADSHH